MEKGEGGETDFRFSLISARVLTRWVRRACCCEAPTLSFPLVLNFDSKSPGKCLKMGLEIESVFSRQA